MHTSEHIPFIGSFQHPFNSKTDVEKDARLENAPNESVFEFRWTGDNKFVIVRSRDDKPYPNRMEVALDVWKDIHSPLDETIIRGEKFGLVFRYHNREKWVLYNMVKDGLKEMKIKTLLDIGSGRGGDVDKWIESGFTHIICVEPTEKNRIELTSRLQAANLERKKKNLNQIIYYIVPTTGQDWQTIYNTVKQYAPNGKVDTISYMLSLSFFFDRIESLHSILYITALTLNSGGYFIALTIDGRYVLEYFNSVANYTETNGVKKSHMRLIDFELRPATTQIQLPHIFVNISESIVVNQTEYLTNIPVLDQLLRESRVGEIPVGLVKITEWRTDKEQFLIPEEIQYSKLFTAMIMKKK